MQDPWGPDRIYKHLLGVSWLRFVHLHTKKLHRWYFSEVGRLIAVILFFPQRKMLCVLNPRYYH